LNARSKSKPSFVHAGDIKEPLFHKGVELQRTDTTDLGTDFEKKKGGLPRSPVNVLNRACSLAVSCFYAQSMPA
jgi:hypothetical protein